jgi:hypothetical protein
MAPSRGLLAKKQKKVPVRLLHALGPPAARTENFSRVAEYGYALGLHEAVVSGPW